jgi:hypothetical protein
MKLPLQGAGRAACEKLDARVRIPIKPGEGDGQEHGQPGLAARCATLFVAGEVQAQGEVVHERRCYGF